ncbi:transcription elongation factor [Metallosphaera hakonensis]|uniref:Transcription elongation factor n=1 Tax=Metallosphaera hakonensis JCM 8857 = DSM 7519 TaxID=1293036 RepID=A0A2U9IU09_9CREN|nr:transcription elongation factor [Metallosphaera hakonensis]AWR99465.1 transcription elongation factor [Metallosphaera hakonensis JCM 8857 = DSM 7519]
MGGKRKKRTKIVKVKPKLPKTFECPRCGKIAMTIKIDKVDSGPRTAHIKCGNCGLCTDIDEVRPIDDEANVYGRFLDDYLEGKLEIKDCRESENENHEDEGEDSELPSETN